MDDRGLLLVLVTCPGVEVAASLARILVEEELAACGNILPGVRSIYRWEGRVHDEPEVLLILKTRPALFERLRARVVAEHPYDVPEVVAVRPEAVHGPYLDWVLAATH